MKGKWNLNAATGKVKRLTANASIHHWALTSNIILALQVSVLIGRSILIKQIREDFPKDNLYQSCWEAGDIQYNDHVHLNNQHWHSSLRQLSALGHGKAEPMLPGN